MFNTYCLAKRLKGLKKKGNLIPLNAADSISFKPPKPDRFLEFQKILIDHRITANIRRPRSIDIAVACGMLAASITSVRQ